MSFFEDSPKAKGEVPRGPAGGFLARILKWACFQEDRMIGEGYSDPPRGARPGPLGPDKKLDIGVKFFLDNRGRKLYSPRFKKEGPTLRG